MSRRPCRRMPKVVIPIYFDYASTLCYVAWRIVRELEGELGFTALWKGVPISLRDHSARPGNSLGPIERIKVMNVVAETGIQVAPPDMWIDSDAALQGSELAREAGVFTPHHETVFRAAFEERLDIARLDVLGEIAAAAGMDGERFRGDIVSRRMGPGWSSIRTRRIVSRHLAIRLFSSAISHPLVSSRSTRCGCCSAFHGPASEGAAELTRDTKAEQVVRR